MKLLAPASARQLDAGLALLRIATGIIFMAHGGQKVFVYGFAGVAGGFAQMGLPMPGVFGPFIGLLELFGGFALVVGLLTRLASLGLASTMLGAIFVVHLKSGFFAPNGFEFPLALLGSTLALLLAGAGGWSVDAMLSNRHRASRQTSPIARTASAKRAA